METLGHSAGVAATAHDKDKLPPNTTYTRVRVDAWLPDTVVATSNTHFTLPVGESWIDVAPETVQRLKGMVEDMDLVEDARRAFDRAINKQMVREKNASSFPAWKREHPGEDLTVAAIKAVCAKDPKSHTSGDAELMHARERFLTETGMSWQGFFSDENGRSPLPLRSVEVTDEGILHPEQERQQEYEIRQAHKVAAIVNANAAGTPRKKGGN